MNVQSKSLMVRYLLRVPLFLLILFLFYLLAKHSIGLVEGFALSLGFTKLVISIISTLLLVFFVFIGVLIIINFFRSTPDS